MDADSQIIEQQLCALTGQEIILVRPSFGTQSDSWVGDLLPYDTTTSPVKFQAASNGMATIFTTEDVKSTQLLTDRTPSFVITLKGPKDYPTA